MKKLLLILLCFSVFSCNETVEKEYTKQEKGTKPFVKKNFKYNFKKGDIIYRKPDSLKVIFDNFNSDSTSVYYYISDKEHSLNYVGDPTVFFYENNK